MVANKTFVDTFINLLTAATEWGIRSFPLKTDFPAKAFTDERHKKNFMRACHRGYEKAQDSILKKIIELRSNPHLPDYEKTFRELVYRRIIDAIAWTILKTETHVIRRFILHDQAPKFDPNVVIEIRKTAEKLNKESRLTFALLADLTTFIHVADILRIDSRKGKISLIEIKSGRVNEILLSELEKYESKPESLKLLRDNRTIPEKYLAQAERILKQKIRLGQIKTVLSSDKGIDIKLDIPIRLLDPLIIKDTYDEILDDICVRAKESRIGIATIQSCIHIGVGFSENEIEARKMAERAALYAIHRQIEQPPPGLLDVRKEFLEIMPEKEFYKGFDLLLTNLFSIGCRPFPLWNINRGHLPSLVERKMFIFSIFDLPGFITIGRSIGLEIGLSSQREATRLAQEYGAKNFPGWGGRVIQVGFGKEGTMKMGWGMLIRLINDLDTPLQFMKLWLKEQNDGRFP